MGIYFFLVVMISGLNLILKPNISNHGRKYYCIIIGFLLIQVIGLRHISMGQYDTEFSYAPAFELIKSLSIEEVIINFSNDTFFYLMTKVFSYVVPNVHGWLYFVSVPLILAVSILIYKESKIPCLSFILFLGLNYYTYSFTILRHSLALSFVIFSYLFWKSKKYVLCFISIVLAVLFQITSIVFVLVFIFYKTKVNIKQILFVLIFLVLVLNFGDTFLNLIFNWLPIERFTRYENHVNSFNLTTFLMNFCIFLFSFYLLRKKGRKEDKTKILLNISVINCFILTFTPVFALSFRIAMFFGVFNLILLPNSISHINDLRLRKLVSLTVGIIFLLYFLILGIENTMVNPYKFFWQQ